MAYDNNNVFARILRDELPSIRVYEDEHTVAFMDIMPQAPGHVLVIPKEAAETLLDLSDDGARAVISTTRHLAIAAKQAFAPQGILVAQMNGAAAGQTVPHIHFHVIPRNAGQEVLAHAAEKGDMAELVANAEKLRKVLAEMAKDEA
ncbi:HIT family protein [Pseudomonas sp. S 311-6]|uniref:HIT family protein n=1 Tax=Kerstersia gyiorum TaxID=206506 RepID=UPI000FD7D831|nr:HIT family protein [Kerstersia gyiorum]AZV94897.1 HIT family protein [Bordetella sp. J329]MCO7635781.1 HIT family protein [Pseudomonas sp. S 311-6]MCH4270659.1 HIT family protein [Kerstersia gyiorum]MCI1230147.1 HIT family protein [Kerstersia gyiorum]QBR41817.1 HIT family protein [Kerstersia gyiorum]